MPRPWIGWGCPFSRRYEAVVAQSSSPFWQGMSAESARVSAWLMETLEALRVGGRQRSNGPDERSSLAHIRSTWPRGLALTRISLRASGQP